ncbi:thioredoxin-like protein [Calycina marina]|uniref:Thioredoxin-like protein n=1 Tax=Calycina marina TaxID=1763456 RepID=A0A9P7Z6C5_9HELO|nr:thioredoxin-like protein [Calycina marina]
MSTLQEITTDEAWNAHESSLPQSTLLIIYFHAPWAAPCKNMTTVLETLASSYPIPSPPTTSWVSINAEELMDVSEAFDVTAVPYIVLTRNKQVLETVSGSDASKVRAVIEKHAKASASAGGSNGVSATSTTSNLAKIPNYAPAAFESSTAPELSSAVTEDKEDLHERLAKLVKAASVMLFMKGTPSAPQCGFSRQTVALLRENSVKYGFFNILADDEVRQGLKEFADWPTFPQLWVDGELVGGLDIVKEELSNDPDFLKPYSVAKLATV